MQLPTSLTEVFSHNRCFPRGKFGTLDTACFYTQALMIEIFGACAREDGIMGPDEYKAYLRAIDYTIEDDWESQWKGQCKALGNADPAVGMTRQDFSHLYTTGGRYRRATIDADLAAVRKAQVRTHSRHHRTKG